MNSIVYSVHLIYLEISLLENSLPDWLFEEKIVIVMFGIVFFANNKYLKISWSHGALWYKIE